MTQYTTLRTYTANETAVIAIATANRMNVTTGLVLGRGKRNYTLWQWTLTDGWKLSFKYQRMLSADLDKIRAEYGDIAIYERLSRDWHTQAELARLVAWERNNMKAQDAERTGILGFGKYKGMQLSEIDDISYLCWLASCPSNAQDESKGLAEWILNGARDRAIELGCEEICGSLFDPNDHRDFAENSRLIKKALEEGGPIEYLASNNAGSLWCVYQFDLPTRIAGHTYYGGAPCLFVDGKCKRAKGKKVVIYDYDVIEGNRIVAKAIAFLG